MPENRKEKMRGRREERAIPQRRAAGTFFGRGGFQEDPPCPVELPVRENGRGQFSSLSLSRLVFCLDPSIIMSGVSAANFLEILLAILLPPLGVFLQEGFGKHFWINVLLTLLGYIPGLVHAVWIIARR